LSLCPPFAKFCRVCFPLYCTRPFSPSCITVVRPLIAFFRYLERVGVLHRDIKADNCLITGDDSNPTAKLIDFGLAKKFDRTRSNVPSFGPSALHDACDDVCAGAAIAATSRPAAPSTGRPSAAATNAHSKLFKAAKQYAPEALNIQRLNLAHQFTHESDLWAVGESSV
jgi:serine/threonine protein kinase